MSAAISSNRERCAPNTITIIGVEDTAGNLMSPDIVTSGTFEVR